MADLSTRNLTDVLSVVDLFKAVSELRLSRMAVILPPSLTTITTSCMERLQSFVAAMPGVLDTKSLCIRSFGSQNRRVTVCGTIYKDFVTEPASRKRRLTSERLWAQSTLWAKPDLDDVELAKEGQWRITVWFADACPNYARNC